MVNERTGEDGSRALEADGGDERRIEAQAAEFSGIDASAEGRPQEAPEQAYPTAEETRERQEELDEMLDESVNRDPETLAADQARMRSDDPLGDLTPEARRLFQRTTELTADDFDMEDLVHQGIER